MSNLDPEIRTSQRSFLLKRETGICCRKKKTRDRCLEGTVEFTDGDNEFVLPPIRYYNKQVVVVVIVNGESGSGIFGGSCGGDDGKGRCKFVVVVLMWR